MKKQCSKYFLSFIMQKNGLKSALIVQKSYFSK